MRSEWEAYKAGSPETREQAAAREWLIERAPFPHGMTLAHVLAGTPGSAIAKLAALASATNETAGTPGPASDSHAENPELDETGKVAITPKPFDHFGSAFSGAAFWPIGSIASVMEGLIQSRGGVHAAAAEVSRLAQLLAEATGEPTSGDAPLQSANSQS